MKNTNLKLISDLNNFAYNKTHINYLFDIITKIINFPKTKEKVHYSIEKNNQNKIIVISNPMQFIYQGINYIIPIKIIIMPKVPQEPPKFILILEKGYILNFKNKDINPKLKQIQTKSLLNWNKNANIETVMKEIFDSFSKNCPICKILQLNSSKKGLLSQINSVYILRKVISLLRERNLYIIKIYKRKLI